MNKDKNLPIIIGLIGLIYLRSSWGKITGGEFVQTLGSTIDRFASKNPYPLMQDYLLNIAKPNSLLFGNLIMWGELLVAVLLIISAVYLLINKHKNDLVITILILGSFGGMLLNGVFWLAAGWTSPSTDSLNLLMFVIELIVISYGLKLKNHN